MWSPMESKGRFFAWSLVTVGLPCAGVAVAFLGRDGDFAQWFVLVGLSFAGAVLWAALTWPYFRHANERIERAAKER